MGQSASSPSNPKKDIGENDPLQQQQRTGSYGSPFTGNNSARGYGSMNRDVLLNISRGGKVATIDALSEMEFATPSALILQADEAPSAHPPGSTLKKNKNGSNSGVHLSEFKYKARLDPRFDEMFKLIREAAANTDINIMIVCPPYMGIGYFIQWVSSITGARVARLPVELEKANTGLRESFKNSSGIKYNFSVLNSLIVDKCTRYRIQYRYLRQQQQQQQQHAAMRERTAATTSGGVSPSLPIQTVVVSVASGSNTGKKQQAHTNGSTASSASNSPASTISRKRGEELSESSSTHLNADQQRSASSGPIGNVVIHKGCMLSDLYGYTNTCRSSGILKENEYQLLIQTIIGLLWPLEKNYCPRPNTLYVYIQPDDQSYLEALKEKFSGKALSQTDFQRVVQFFFAIKSNLDKLFIEDEVMHRGASTSGSGQYFSMTLRLGQSFVDDSAFCMIMLERIIAHLHALIKSKTWGNNGKFNTEISQQANSLGATLNSTSSSSSSSQSVVGYVEGSIYPTAFVDHAAIQEKIECIYTLPRIHRTVKGSFPGLAGLFDADTLPGDSMLHSTAREAQITQSQNRPFQSIRRIADDNKGGASLMRYRSETNLASSRSSSLMNVLYDKSSDSDNNSNNNRKGPHEETGTYKAHAFVPAENSLPKASETNNVTSASRIDSGQLTDVNLETY